MTIRSAVIVKNPSDFVGAALGQSEQQTKGILAASLGKVLVIDEAYGLYGGSSGDPYKTAVVDTIVAEVQSVPGDDRCVLLLGYKDQMEDMFQNVNPGLARRFPIASAFQFEDFSDDELREILDLKLSQQGYAATDQAKRVAVEVLSRARNRPNFGNAGEVDIMLDAAKARHQARLSRGEAQFASRFEALDLDPDFDRAERSDTNVEKLFEGTVGMEATVSLLQGYQETVKTMKALGMDPKENIPFNFLFRGPPGTGKTTTAKKMGKVCESLLCLYHVKSALSRLSAGHGAMTDFHLDQSTTWVSFPLPRSWSVLLRISSGNTLGRPDPRYRSCLIRLWGGCSSWTSKYMRSSAPWTLSSCSVGETSRRLLPGLRTTLTVFEGHIVWLMDTSPKRPWTSSLILSPRTSTPRS